MIRFLLILTLTIVYTSFKATQLWPTNRWAAAGLVLPFFAIMIGWNFLYRADPGIFNQLWFEILAWTGCILMSVWATYIIFSIPVDIVHLLVTLGRKMAGPHDPQRRSFISQGFKYGLLGASGALAGLGLIDMVRGPRVKQVAIGFPNLPQSLKNLKIALISDLHVGPTVRRGYVEDVVQKTNQLEADLIFVTGDMTDGKMEELGQHLLPFKNLKSKYGIYYVTGNHEYYWGASEMIELFRSYGFIPLLNENVIVDVDSAKVMIAGITDKVGGQFIPTHAPNIHKANQTSEKVDFKILLSHRPEAFDDAKNLGFNLQCSGHTHAGQFIPFNFLVPLAHKYYKGLNKVGELQLYVSPGTGYWGPVNRFGVPSEISLLKLA
jgi:predicted MPP superfamily phosphohydrolase